MLNSYKSLILSLLLLMFITLIGATSHEIIDEKIESLYLELEEARKKAFNDEMEAQPLMFDNWREYREDIEKHQGDEKRIEEIKQKIQDLQNQRAAIENSVTIHKAI